jgi:hypothetical protein
VPLSRSKCNNSGTSALNNRGPAQVCTIRAKGQAMDISLTCYEKKRRQNSSSVMAHCNHWRCAPYAHILGKQVIAVLPLKRSTLKLKSAPSN